MNNLQNYIDKIKEKTKDYSELEKVRYVYLELGKIMSFDLDFSFGNMKNKLKIYNDCKKEEEYLQKYFENQIIICKSLAYLLEYILNQMGIKAETIFEDSGNPNYKHVLNLITLNNGFSFKVDLQADLENIQAHLKTNFFGIHSKFGFTIFSSELSRIDQKIGYISEKNGYTNDYLYLINRALKNNVSIDQKVEFILQNINVYTDNKKVKYAERRWYYLLFIKSLLTEKETNKVKLIDTYNENDYQICIVVDMPFNEKNIYLFNNENQKFIKMDLKQFADKINDGLVATNGIPGLKKYLKK